MPNMEERVYPLAHLEVRAGDPTRGDPPRISGLAAVYGEWSEDLGGFKERVVRGAFSKTIAEADVRATFNHDPNYVLGRTKPGTLTLRSTAEGLATEIAPPDTSWARDLMVTMARGDVDQMSFLFRPIRERWSDKPDPEDGLYTRDLQEVKLYDVSVVTFPAYTGTSAQVRSVLARAGIPFDDLASILDRAQRGASPSPSDVEILRGTLATLTAIVPPAAPAAPGGDHPAPQHAGRSIAHLQRLLELSETL